VSAGKARGIWAYRALAPAKVNLGLFVGPVRERDGRHELVSVMQSISLADELTLRASPSGAVEDEVVCPGVGGPSSANLAAGALRAFRAGTGWDAPPLRLDIVKRIPVAAGLGGGSADAAAALRLAARASGLGGEELLSSIAAELGADVPAQVSPGRWLASGAGEQLRPLAPPRAPFGLLVLPLAAELSTAAVYAEADRLGLSHTPAALAQREAELSAALEHGAALPAATELLHNDLQRAAVSLCPQILPALAQARTAGADHALLSGSGPTVLGLFLARGSAKDGLARAEAAAGTLAGRTPAPICASPVDAEFARALPAEDSVRDGS
jgi:4-diphosphocytidyl-2-C-methyl-D-erythritol kinase